MSFQANFASQDYFRNPAAAIERLRAQGPVVRVHFPIVGQVWATTTQGLADRVLKDTKTFTIRKDDGTVAGMQWWMPKVIRTLANSMLSMDDPGHARLRDIVDEAFRRRAVLGMEPRIQAIGETLADELFAEGSPSDLVERYARKLPLAVISELLGLPAADRAKFHRLGQRFHPLHRHGGISRRDPEDAGDAALHGTACRGRQAIRRRGTGRRNRAGREGGCADQRR
jgi:cytochrome P450